MNTVIIEFNVFIATSPLYSIWQHGTTKAHIQCECMDVYSIEQTMYIHCSLFIMSYKAYNERGAGGVGALLVTSISFTYLAGIMLAV